MNPSTLSLIVSKAWGQGLGEGRGETVFLSFRPRHYDKVANRKEVLTFLPRLDLYKGVAPQDEEKGIQASLSEKPDGIDGVRFSRP